MRVDVLCIVSAVRRIEPYGESSSSMSSTQRRNEGLTDPLTASPPAGRPNEGSTAGFCVSGCEEVEEKVCCFDSSLDDSLSRKPMVTIKQVIKSKV